ncbi:MAG: outer membrane protein assembly factor BamD [Planctomycetota bacterium]
MRTKHYPHLFLLVTVGLFSGCATSRWNAPTLPLFKPKPTELTTTAANSSSVQTVAHAEPVAEPEQGSPNRPWSRSLQSSLDTLESAVPDSLHDVVTRKKKDAVAAKQHFQRAEATYRRAIDLEGEEREATFREAAKYYNLAARDAADPVTHEDSLFQLGESYFFANDYPKASVAYGGLLKNFPTSRYIDRVDQRRFMVSEYWLKSKEQDSEWDVLPNLTNKRRPVADTFGYAVKQLDRIRYDNPTGKLADDATMAAAVAHYDAGKLGKADELFTDLRDNFPASEHQFQAHLFGLRCKLDKYEGPDYDGSILDDSEELITTMLRHFPQQAKEHEDYLNESFKGIRLKKAQRDFAVAQYYDNRKEFAAARVYYDQVRTEYADTNLALEAESRLAQIEQEPDSPEQSMQWLAKAFPDLEDKPLIKR